MTHELLKDMISRSFRGANLISTYIETLTWLLDQNEGVRITEDMLLCAGSIESVELLWARMAESTISNEMLERAVYSTELFRMSLGKVVKPVITERLLVRTMKRCHKPSFRPRN